MQMTEVVERVFAELLLTERFPRLSRCWKNMPEITSHHVCRHTFGSNMEKSRMNPKTLQYIMGHTDISETLNTYTYVNFDDAKEAVFLFGYK